MLPLWAMGSFLGPPLPHLCSFGRTHGQRFACCQAKNLILSTCVLVGSACFRREYMHLCSPWLLSSSLVGLSPELPAPARIPARNPSMMEEWTASSTCAFCFWTLAVPYCFSLEEGLCSALPVWTGPGEQFRRPFPSRFISSFPFLVGQWQKAFEKASQMSSLLACT